MTYKFGVIRMIKNEFELKQLIVDIGKRIWTRGYVAANDGNITVRISKNEILTTPTGVSKGFMSPDMIIKIDMDGNVITRNTGYKPSSEIKMHLEVYKERSDINGVIHAHPPYCTSFAVAGIPLNRCVLPEAIITLGAVPIVPYGTPSTREIPESIKPFIKNSDAILLANHGALTLGTDLLTAYYRMETLEHSAHIIFLAIQLGNVNILPEGEVKKLMDVREKMNIPGRIMMCQYRPDTDRTDTQKISTTEITEKITRDVLERLSK